MKLQTCNFNDRDKLKCSQEQKNHELLPSFMIEIWNIVSSIWRKIDGSFPVHKSWTRGDVTYWICFAIFCLNISLIFIFVLISQKSSFIWQLNKLSHLSILSKDGSTGGTWRMIPTFFSPSSDNRINERDDCICTYIIIIYIQQGKSYPIGSMSCLVYLPTFTIKKNQMEVKYTYHCSYGYWQFRHHDVSWFVW